jgi:hypothetical protein
MASKATKTPLELMADELYTERGGDEEPIRDETVAYKKMVDLIVAWNKKNGHDPYEYSGHACSGS